MNRATFAVVALAMASAVGAAQAADYPPPPPVTQGNTHFAWADVLRVDPVYQTVSVQTPRQDCYGERVIERRGGNSTAGTILGAVVGGVLGNQVGKGDGRKAATVAGAVAGGAIGHATVEGNAQTRSSTRQHCQQVADVHQEQRIQGYDVEYRYRGEVYTSQLDYDPGERLRVRVSVSPAD